MAYCSNCGTKLADGVKFCSECGAKIDITSTVSNEQRKIIYDGEIHKCPNCGDIIDAFELKCEACGYEIRGIKSSSGAQAFSNEIRRIAKAGGKGASKRISTFISTFPIPNSKEDLLEFFLLSASNIDIKAYGFGASEMPEDKKAISDAYYAKFEQAYAKSKILFGGTPEFEYISFVYLQKLKEIRSAKKRRVIAVLAIVFGSISVLLSISLMGIYLSQ